MSMKIAPVGQPANIYLTREELAQTPIDDPRICYIGRDTHTLLQQAIAKEIRTGVNEKAAGALYYENSGPHAAHWAIAANPDRAVARTHPLVAFTLDVPTDREKPSPEAKINPGTLMVVPRGSDVHAALSYMMFSRITDLMGLVRPLEELIFIDEVRFDRNRAALFIQVDPDGDEKEVELQESIMAEEITDMFSSIQNLRQRLTRVRTELYGSDPLAARNLANREVLHSPWVADALGLPYLFNGRDIVPMCLFTHDDPDTPVRKKLPDSDTGKIDPDQELMAMDGNQFVWRKHFSARRPDLYWAKLITNFSDIEKTAYTGLANIAKQFGARRPD